MYTLYKFHFLNGISEINQLFDDILLYDQHLYIYIYIYIYIKPQIRKSWDSMENANKKRK